MQKARIYRAWLPSLIYSLLFSPFLQHYHITERLLRATKRSKFSRTLWEFCVLINAWWRQWEIPKQKVIQIDHIASIFTQFFAFVRQLKMFQCNWTRKLDIFSTLINCSTEIFWRKCVVEFWFNRCFREISLRNYKKKELSIAFYPNSHVFAARLAQWISAGLLNGRPLVQTPAGPTLRVFK